MWNDDDYVTDDPAPSKDYKVIVAILAVAVIAGIAVNLYFKWNANV